MATVESPAIHTVMGVVGSTPPVVTPAFVDAPPADEPSVTVPVTSFVLVVVPILVLPPSFGPPVELGPEVVVPPSP